MSHRHQERMQEEQDRGVQLLSWGAPFLIGLVLFLIVLAAYSVRPLLRWLGLL